VFADQTARPRPFWRDSSDSHDDVSKLAATYRHAPLEGWRLERLKVAYDLAGKVRALKMRGEWPPSDDGLNLGHSEG
jgi:hypothetical protein